MSSMSGMYSPYGSSSSPMSSPYGSASGMSSPYPYFGYPSTGSMGAYGSTGSPMSQSASASTMYPSSSPYGAMGSMGSSGYGSSSAYGSASSAYPSMASSGYGSMYPQASASSPYGSMGSGFIPAAQSPYTSPYGSMGSSAAQSPYGSYASGSSSYPSPSSGYGGYPGISAKGLIVVAGKGRGQVCTDCQVSKFDIGELRWALVMLASVLTMFLAVCFCRCYPKLKAVLFKDPIELRNEARARKVQKVQAVHKANVRHHQYLRKVQKDVQASNRVHKFSLPVDINGKVIEPPPGWTYPSSNVQSDLELGQGTQRKQRASSTSVLATDSGLLDSSNKVQPGKQLTLTASQVQFDNGTCHI
ncbi:hypothetical protein HDE_10430 [Halotydeus destructor]|nr:hypothetical protein HDE_10430 [Halotydeus destructor]